MKFKSTYFFLVSNCLFVLFVLSTKPIFGQETSPNKIVSAANQTEKYVPLLKNKSVAIVANQTSVIRNGTEDTHLVDTLISLDVNIVQVFGPEHGFRGMADAGEHVNDDKDPKTGIPIISLHGKNRKPTHHQLENIDVVVFDIQDVGVRFYTYISTLTYVMEACAEMNIPVLVLDRPNPNAHYVDGPTLKMEHKSFVGMHPVPLVYGMTIGEYAYMVNGEQWMKKGVKCDLKVIRLKNYTHNSEIDLSIRPSPNLPNSQAINLYPSLGFFEGTIINAGRGTEFQFQRYGAPFFPKNNFSYTPLPNFGSKNPKFEGEICYGVNLEKKKRLHKVNLEWLIDAYNKTPKGKDFFGNTFTIHAGNLSLQNKIEKGFSAEDIRKSWQKDIDEFQKIRIKYLIYK